MLCSVDSFFPGSPPRVRGKGKIMQRVALQLGITPARAGKSDQLTGNALGTRDHPRACGEKFQKARWQAIFGGSPPRVRGKERSPFR